mmetsp:Transcript_53434/g.159497  ORF Transcript_53434/g.159497 Transcript_53434/m.159497 type:complete len:220 (-) Transcript_53434:214-873(-)
MRGPCWLHRKATWQRQAGFLRRLRQRGPVRRRFQGRPGPLSGELRALQALADLHLADRDAAALPALRAVGVVLAEEPGLRPAPAARAPRRPLHTAGFQLLRGVWLQTLHEHVGARQQQRVPASRWLARSGLRPDAPRAREEPLPRDHPGEQRRGGLQAPPGTPGAGNRDDRHRLLRPLGVPQPDGGVPATGRADRIQPALSVRGQRHAELPCCERQFRV